MSGRGGAALAGRYLNVEAAVAAAAAVLFGVSAGLRILSYRSSGDDFADGSALFLIGLVLATAILFAVYAPVAILLGRSLRRGTRGARVGGLVLFAAPVLADAVAFPLLVPLGVLGAVALAVLLLPQTRAECAPPPLLEDA